MTQAAFEEKVVALTQTLYRVSATLLPRLCDRQDAVQSCILLAWQHRHSVRNEGAFRPWLIRILINECYTLLRKHKHMTLVDTPEMPYSPMDSALRDETLYTAVQSLPEKNRLVVELHYVEGAGLQEIAQILRVPLGTVKSRLHAARGMLRDRLKEEV